MERASSVVVLPLQGPALLLPAGSWRPGVGRVTLDFPGGRLPEGERPAVAAAAAVARELAVPDSAIVSLQGLSPEEGWDVDSSFSSQRLHGFVARLHDDACPAAPGIERVPATAAGVASLMQRLRCLQCRAVLQAWAAGGVPTGSDRPPTAP